MTNEPLSPASTKLLGACERLITWMRGDDLWRTELAVVDAQRRESCEDATSLLAAAASRRAEEAEAERAARASRAMDVLWDRISGRTA